MAGAVTLQSPWVPVWDPPGSSTVCGAGGAGEKAILGADAGRKSPRVAREGRPAVSTLTPQSGKSNCVPVMEA
ncbi:unnamed protein product [Gadus morhua 'NCC']